MTMARFFSAATARLRRRRSTANRSRLVTPRSGQKGFCRLVRRNFLRPDREFGLIAVGWYDDSGGLRSHNETVEHFKCHRSREVAARYDRSDGRYGNAFA